MIARYDPSDSTFTIYGDGGDSTGNIGAQISFVLRDLPYPSKTQYGLPDTGTFLLDLTVPLVFLVAIDSPPLEGSASVALWPDTVGNLTNYTWFTDSMHTGTLKITEVDTVNNLFSGTFNFLAVDTSKGSSMADTVRIDSGIISKMRLD